MLLPDEADVLSFDFSVEADDAFLLYLFDFDLASINRYKFLLIVPIDFFLVYPKHPHRKSKSDSSAADFLAPSGACLTILIPVIYTV